MDIGKIYEISKKILKIEVELDHYNWQIFREKELDPDEDSEYNSLIAKRNKLAKKLKKCLLNR